MLNRPSGPQSFIAGCHVHLNNIVETCLVEPQYLIANNPALIWPLPGYVPPPQSDPKNKNGFARSAERKRLERELTNQIRAKEVTWNGEAPKEKRLVLISVYKQGKLYDQGNLVQACKALLDSLQPMFLKNDSAEWCSDYYTQRIVKDPGEVGTAVIIYPILAIASTFRRVKFERE